MKFLPAHHPSKLTKLLTVQFFHFKLNHRNNFPLSLNPLKGQYFIAEMTLSDLQINETIVTVL
jgi:hypothetical protein